MSSIECLVEFNATETNIRQLPPFILFSKKLRFLCIGGTASNPISFWLPTSLSSLSSLERLDLRYCNLLDEALPSDLGCLTLLYFLDLSGNKFTRIPECVYQLPRLVCLYLSNCNNIQALEKPLLPPLWSLIELDLSYCNLLDGTILSDLNCLSPSLLTLGLSGNKFTRISDSISQLSWLFELKLDHCSRLQALPKLPLTLTELHLENCPSMGKFSDQPDVLSGEMLLTSDYSLLVLYFGYNGKSYKTLHLHSRSLVRIENDPDAYNFALCGPTLGFEIPGWFNHRSISSSGMIRTCIDCDLEHSQWWGCAMFIVYEVHESDNCQRKRKKRKVHEHENSNPGIIDGNKHNFPEFFCQIQMNEDGPRFPFVFSVPEDAPVGPNGFWALVTSMYLLTQEGNFNQWRNLGVSISTSSRDVKVKECGMRLVYPHDTSEWFQVLSSNSPNSWDSEEDFLDLYAPVPNVYGPIKGNGML